MVSYSLPLTDPQPGFSAADAEDDVFFEMLNIPVCTNLLWADPTAAKQCPRADIRLAFNSRSGFIHNVAFDPNQLAYSQTYENRLDSSPRFQQYAQSLAAQLIDRHQLHQKTILEIGCGKGDFLLLLCQLGDNRGIGFDPSYIPQPLPEPLPQRVEFIQDYYSDRYSDYPADLIVCRHTLEHIPDPMQFLTLLRHAIGDRQETVLFFEVPNALDTFHNLAVWDIIYEHCCYFAPAALSYLFACCGFAVQQITEAYDGQFLCLEATPAPVHTTLSQQQQQDICQLAADVAVFTAHFKSKIDSWNQQLQQLAAAGNRTVVWGAGAKGNIFLNVLETQDQIDYVVDINTRKQGMYIAGTGQKIVSPQFLQTYQPSIIFVMNRIYAPEIEQMMRELGCEATLICV